jgi:enoyl-CoA hydratase/carnithine racemase
VSATAPDRGARDQPTSGPLRVDRRDDAIAVLTLARPERRNSLSEEMLGALHEAILALGQDDGVRVVLIAAEGPAFSAGHDLKEITARRADADRGRTYFADILQRCAATMQAVVRCPKPVIAEVNGLATAAGCQLVASCDLAIASQDARFATPGVQIGLFCSTPMVALSRNVAPKHAMEMLLTGAAIDAETALRFGLVNRVVPVSRLRDETLDWARGIAAKPAHTLKIGKEAFYRQREMTLADAYDHASKVMVENMLSRDAEEGIGAFLEKRAPTWRNS